MIIFILLGGVIIRCVLSSEIALSFCSISDYKTFGAFAVAGLLEVIYEMKGVIGIFQKRKSEGDEEDEE